jgi:hypothetical protein
LIGPKFPQIIAAASFARLEILNYFRHVGQEKSVRKDCKKHYNNEDFVSYDVSSLIFILGELTDHVLRYQGIIWIDICQFSHLE